jgi:hypothetical protein
LSAVIAIALDIGGITICEFMKSNWRISLCVVLCLLSGVARGVEPKLELSHSGPEATVKLTGEAGTEYLIESARGSIDEWAPVASFILSDPSRLWKDASANGGNRFFRARTKVEADVEYAHNFRLIDQNGVSRELEYYASLESLKAIVLIFAEGNYGTIAPKIAPLRTAFPNNVFFWTIETGLSNTRSNILKEAAAAGLTTPVYHDPMQLVTHQYEAHSHGEAVVIDRATMAVAYRGLFEEGGVNYVRQALDAIVAAGPVLTSRLEPQQGNFNARAEVVADYATVIAPLLQNKCVSCHSPGNVAPFAMTNHAVVAEWSESIEHAVFSGHMPPWHADPQYGKFANDNSLTPTEKAQLMDWIAAGAPRGTGADPLMNVPPPPPDWPVELGPPDQIVTIPVQQIPATGLVDYRYIYANATNSTDRWLKAAVIKPGNRRVVHHYIIWEGHTSSQQLSGIAGYVPGREPKGFPVDTGVLLKANSPLTFNLHYTATGQAETDQPQLGLWYAATPPAKPLKTAGASDGAFFLGFTSIPPGNPDYQMTANAHIIDSQPIATPVRFNTPVRVYSFSPHMHVRGSRMRFELTLPGSSTRQILLSVPKYDFMWQTVYTLETPLDLPAGAQIDVIGAFDNSAQNIYNPDPTIAVKWGEQSWDEMFIGYIEYSQR